QEMHGGPWKAFHDHRIATTGALVGLRVPGVVIDDIGTTAKTMPQFAGLWQGMLEGCRARELVGRRRRRGPPLQRKPGAGAPEPQAQTPPPEAPPRARRRPA